jgi:hypothetical protein
MSFGKYPDECADWMKELQDLNIKITGAYLKIDPITGRATGIAPADIPRFFAEQGMEKVSAYPLGNLYSLSNAAMSDDDKLRWIDLYRDSEVKKLDAFMELPEMLELISPEQAARYRELVDRKCSFLRSDLTENRIWEWRGTANLLVTGIMPG